MSSMQYPDLQAKLARFLLEIDGLSLEFPHTAIMSYSDRTNTYFYNVYFNSSVEDALDTIDDTGFDAMLLLNAFVHDGYNVSIKTKNKDGFCQCTCSYSNEVGSKRETHLLSGEGGSIQTAIISCYIKHRLIRREDGQWAFTTKLMKTERKYR